MNVQNHRTLAGSRILVVEDDPFIAMDLQDRLSGLGVNVIGPVPAVLAALRAIGDALPDAAVLDVNLRGEKSTPIACALSKAEVPFVVLTGYSRGQLDPELQAATILPKPYCPLELARVLERLLRRS